MLTSAAALNWILFRFEWRRVLPLNDFPQNENALAPPRFYLRLEWHGMARAFPTIPSTLRCLQLTLLVLEPCHSLRLLSSSFSLGMMFVDGRIEVVFCRIIIIIPFVIHVSITMDHIENIALSLHLHPQLDGSLTTDSITSSTMSINSKAFSFPSDFFNICLCISIHN